MTMLSNDNIHDDVHVSQVHTLNDVHVSQVTKSFYILNVSFQHLMEDVEASTFLVLSVVYKKH